MHHEQSILLTVTYLLYLALSISMTVWVAKTLHKNGRVFLIDSFNGNEQLADSVNHLLVVGFYLINIGYITLALSEHPGPSSIPGAIEMLSLKFGIVLVILGVMHLFNVFVISRMRRRAIMQKRMFDELDKTTNRTEVIAQE